MSYGSFAGYVKQLNIAGATLLLDSTFESYLAAGPGTTDWKTYILDYTGVTGTITFYASTPSIPIPVTALDVEVYNAGGIPFDHPTITDAYIALQ
jgi:hypothetical protein